MIKQVLTKILAHKAAIALFGAAGGVVVTSIFAVKDSRKHERNIASSIDEKYQEIKDDFDTPEEAFESISLSKKEQAIIFAKSYWRTGLSMAVTFGLMILSHRSMAKELAATAAALGVMGTKYKELDAELKKQAPEIHKKVHDILDERIIRGKVATENRGKDPEENRYYEEFSGQVFFATESEIKESECELNKLLINTGQCTLFDYLASFPSTSGIKLQWWMKHVGWYEGDTSYSYNSGYFGSYVDPEIVNEPMEIGGKMVDVYKIRWSHMIDFDPELDENEIGCLEAELEDIPA